MSRGCLRAVLDAREEELKEMRIDGRSLMKENRGFTSKKVVYYYLQYKIIKLSILVGLGIGDGE